MEPKMASPKDKQAELRTKVPLDLWRAVDRYADKHNMTLYQATRHLIRSGLEAELPALRAPKN